MSSIYTYEQVKEEFESSGLELISTEYNSPKQKMQYICIKHRDVGIQEIDFSHLHYRHQGCIFCGREKTAKARAIPESAVKEKSESLGWEYIGRTMGGSYEKHSLIHVICPKHRDKGIQDVLWSSINAGRGCKYCARNVRLTPEEYRDRISKKLPHIEILTNYVSQKQRVTAHCKTHDITWEVLPYDLLRETACGCSECRKLVLRDSHLKSYDERVRELSENNPDIELLSEDVETRSKTTFRCKICGHIWETIYGDHYFLGKKSCPQCTKKRHLINSSKTDVEFRKELREHLPHIVPLSKYVNAKTIMTFHCTKHDYTYYATPPQVLKNKNGCPKCTPKYCENLISKYLDAKNISYIREYRFQDCVDKKTLPFDYFVPSYNTIIEYDGEDHYIPINRNGRGKQVSIDKLKYTQRHDEIKTSYCSDNNIILVRIPYWEKENIDNILDKKLVYAINQDA